MVYLEQDDTLWDKDVLISGLRWGFHNRAGVKLKDGGALKLAVGGVHL